MTKPLVPCIQSFINFIREEHKLAIFVSFYFSEKNFKKFSKTLSKVCFIIRNRLFWALKVRKTHKLAKPVGGHGGAGNHLKEYSHKKNSSK